jgi:predicted DNA-binding protein with PD1-like motif
MQFYGGSGAIAVRLAAGEEVHSTLSEICRKCGISSAFVISGIGMLANPELGFLVEPGHYDRHRFDGEYELLNLSGNIAPYQGELLPHLHVTLSGRDHRAFGGHLFTAHAAITVEVLLLQIDESSKMRREFEAETGLPGLQLN